MNIESRAQRDLDLAARLVGEVEAAFPAGAPERSRYGNLCHGFPMLVRACGLCQALAFSADKKTHPADRPATARNRAHELLLSHVAKVLAVDDALAAVREADTLQYMCYTRQVLAAWVYFKRFAVSILEVEGSRASDEDEDAG